VGDSTPKLTAEERAAMKEYLAEQRAAAKRAKSETAGAENLADVLAKIAAMAPNDRELAQGLHELIARVTPELAAKTWYGMQAYFLGDQVVCFFQDAGKFKTRYCTLGFQQAAALDDGDMWPTSYALLELTPSVAAQVEALLLRAVGR
jgi:uncharacterized protein YdhG (YjbR/CyaY superfamily)